MQLFRTAARRQAKFAAVRPTWYRRAQHDGHGPHKEYFQHPGQTPIPDATPYVPPRPIPVIQGSSGPSRIVRAARSVSWAILFYVFGSAAGTALITWQYLQPPFEQGSPEDDEMIEEILDTLETHPLVESLREEQWIEDNRYASQLRGMGTGLHLVWERLTGTQGITAKAFRHPSQECTMLVFFLGFGMEGWPDVIHGGILTTLLQEGVDQHIHNFYAHEGTAREQVISVDFKKPVRPGEIYAILVPPGATETNPIPGQKVIQLVPILMHMEAAPRVRSSFDAASNQDQHVIDVRTPGAVDTTHAVGTTQVRLVVDNQHAELDRRDGDSP